jgi:lipoprotein-releasing system ATP-binding protein
MNKPNGSAVACLDLHKTFVQGKVEVKVLMGVNLDVQVRERVAIVGASGSGKSTLLHLLGGLDTPTRGEVRVMGQDISKQTEAERGVTRNRALGFVYQFHHLLPEFSALENVAMPLLIRRTPRAEAYDAASKVLGEVGLAHRLTHTPGELSGGERQRAAVARALVLSPKLLLADEPTGALDHANAQRLAELLSEVNTREKVAIVMVTHARELAARMGRMLELREGKLVGI